MSGTSARPGQGHVSEVSRLLMMANSDNAGAAGAPSAATQVASIKETHRDLARCSVDANTEVSALGNVGHESGDALAMLASQGLVGTSDIRSTSSPGIQLRKGEL